MTTSEIAITLWPSDFWTWYERGTGGASIGGLPGRYRIIRPPAPENRARITGCLASRLLRKVMPALS
jgi:hypothetical protein